MSVILIAAVFLCGIPIGFVIGLMIAARMFCRTDDDDDFDGGYSAENPPVRTIIWSRSVDDMK